MQFNKFILAPSALFLKEPASLEEWCELSTFLCNIQRSVPWWIGDMVERGEQAHGDLIYQAFDETMSVNMVQRYSKVCREFPPLARNATLSHSHHAKLIGLPKEVQAALLARAELEGWDNERMGRELRCIK